jgi:hypothetical protein
MAFPKKMMRSMVQHGIGEGIIGSNPPIMLIQYPSRNPGLVLDLFIKLGA